MGDISAHDLARVEKKVDDLTRQMNDLLIAWNAAVGIGRFMKFLGSLATGALALWGLAQTWTHK